MRTKLRGNCGRDRERWNAWPGDSVWSYAITARFAARFWGYETPSPSQGTTTTMTESSANMNGLSAGRQSDERVNRHPENRLLVTAMSRDALPMTESWIGFRQEFAKAWLATVSERHLAQRPREVASDAAHCAPWKMPSSPQPSLHRSISSM
jgi:hypothetical protein